MTTPEADTTPATPAPLATAAPVSLSALGQWSRDARDAWQIARSLAATAFVPESMQNDPGLVTAAILTGQEIGLQPMAALRSIDIIRGTPAMRAHTMRGLVQAAGHEVWADDDSNSQWAVVYGRRKGSDKIQRSTWTMDRAKDLGLAGKDQYRKQPATMLIARGTGEVCRLIASDVLLGMPYAAEELSDGNDPEESAPEPPKRRKRTAQRKPVDPEPPPLEEPAPDPAGDEPGDQGDQGDAPAPEVAPDE